MHTENDLESRCVQKIEALGGEAWKLVLLRRRGFPDRSIFLPGIPAFFVEFKRPKKGRVSAQQTEVKRRLTELGQTVYVVDNFPAFLKLVASQIGHARVSKKRNNPSV